MPSIARLVDGYRPHINPARLFDEVAWISAVDRLQGSIGLHRIAGEVADRAGQLGLAVDLRHYRPGHRWWAYTAPTAASPISASLDLLDPTESITSYPAQSCALARGSASTEPRTVRVALLGQDPAGALVVCTPQPRFALTTLLDDLRTAGAAAVAIESPFGQLGPDTVARLELPDDCPLAGFSISATQAARLRRAGTRPARIAVRHDPPADMPLVHAHRRGRPGGPRALLIAHLCHPAPSANDNASGVAGLLALAAAVQQVWPPGAGPTIDLLWAPEMVGAAAYLHDIALTRTERKPDLVLSLDMIGGTGHLILEDAPDHCPAPLAAALAAACRHVRPDQLSYSHAVALPTWPHAVTPFVGASDHLLFADRSIAIPAGHVACWPDPAHHTSHDTIDRIARLRLADTVTAVAAAVTALCVGGDALAEIATTQAALTAERLARTPYESGSAAYRQHISTTAVTTMTSWHTPPPTTAVPALSEPAVREANPIVRTWTGPWNLQNLTAALPTERQTDLAQLLDPAGPGYARLVGLAHAIDDLTGPHGLTIRAQRATGLDIEPATTAAFVDIMRAAGWIQAAPTDG